MPHGTCTTEHPSRSRSGPKNRWQPRKIGNRSAVARGKIRTEHPVSRIAWPSTAFRTRFAQRLMTRFDQTSWRFTRQPSAARRRPPGAGPARAPPGRPGRSGGRRRASRPSPRARARNPAAVAADCPTLAPAAPVVARDTRSPAAQHLGRRVGRAVVHKHDLEPRQPRTRRGRSPATRAAATRNLGDELRQALRLILRRNNHRKPRPIRLVTRLETPSAHDRDRGRAIGPDASTSSRLFLSASDGSVPPGPVHLSTPPS